MTRRLLLMALVVLGLPALAAAQNGTVSGTVISTASNGPIAGRSLLFCTSAQCFSTPNTDASGNYTLSLPPGTYVAFTSNFNTLNFVNEIYNNIPCPGTCNFSVALSSGTGIVVTSGGSVTGINFSLDTAASISGRVTDAVTGAGVSGITVTVRTLVGTLNLSAGSASTNSSGDFTVTGLSTGAYYLATSAGSTGYTNEIYDNILCAGSCSSTLMVASGTPVLVFTGTNKPGINFALDAGGRVSGTVTSTQGGAPLQNVTVQAFTRIGLSIFTMGTATTNASGVYTIGGLPTGTYYLSTSTNLGINEVYDNLPCPIVCTSTLTVTTGAPVPVTVNTTTSGKDFQLNPGGSISGTLTDSGTAQVLANISVQVYNSTGGSVTSGVTNASGVYSIGGLTTGNYFVAAQPSPFYARKVLGGPNCVVFCQTAELLAGTPVAVVTGAVASGRDIALEAAGTISGTVTSASGAPLTNVTVFIATSNGSIGFGTASDGSYSLTGIPAGSYKIFTSTGSYVNEAYNNVACPTSFCSTAFVNANGTPVGVSVGGTTANINFSLDPVQGVPGSPGTPSATVTNGTAQITWSAPGSGGAATSYILEAGLSPGTTLGTLPTATNSLTIPGVPVGTFYLRVRAVNSFGTGPASAEFKLVVGNGGSGTPNPPTNLVAWMSGGRLTMTWTAPSTGEVPTSYVLEAGSAVGLSNLAVVELPNRSFTFDPIPSGFFFLRVRSKANGVVSAPTADVMINVGNVPAPPSPPQSLNTSVSGSTLTISWSAPAIGTATSYIIEAGTATGLSNIGVVDTGNPNTSLTVPGVPPGTYYLRVRAVNAQGTSPESNERSVTVP